MYCSAVKKQNYDWVMERHLAFFGHMALYKILIEKVLQKL